MKNLLFDSYDGCVITRQCISNSKLKRNDRKRFGFYVPPYPKPLSGLQYTRAQVYHVLIDIPATFRGAVIDDMIIRKLVPCGKSNLYKIMRERKKIRI